MKKEEENKPNNNRRDFIKTSAIAAAGFITPFSAGTSLITYTL